MPTLSSCSFIAPIKPLGLFLVVTVLLTGCLDIPTKSYSNSLFSGETFESCLINGGTVQESYPRSCALNGRFYTEDISPADEFEKTILVFEVSPQTISCQGLQSAQLQCLIVNGEYFYDDILGFIHQPGKAATIEVERSQICDPSLINSCPQDIGIYQYRWLRNIPKS
ncbi:MAG: DUF4377 domain-containing protein [Oceanospirillaceae bacterium]